MVAGTSSGAILAGILVAPDGENSSNPKNYAVEYRNNFNDAKETVLKRQEFAWLWFWIQFAGFFVLFFAIGWLGAKEYRKDQVEEKLINCMKDLVQDVSEGLNYEEAI